MTSRWKRCLVAGMMMALLPSKGGAYTVHFQDGSQIKEFDLQNNSQIPQIEYGLSAIKLLPRPVDLIQIDRPVPMQEASAETSFLEKVFPVGVAEASHEPDKDVIQCFLNAGEAVKNSVRLKEIQPFITDNVHEMLRNKILSGVNEITMLMTMRELFPENPQIYDFYVHENVAQMTAGGRSSLGDLKGIITMVRENGEWKLAQAQWLGRAAADMKDVSPLHLARGLEKDRITLPDYTYRWGLSNYYFDRNYLSLVHIKNHFPKDRFVFLFYWDKGHKINEKKLNELNLKGGNRPSHLHILWTGPCQFLSGQQVYQDKYPLDVSIAPEKEGYMSGNLNLRLPKKKPKGVMAAVWISF